MIDWGKINKDDSAIAHKVADRAVKLIKELRGVNTHVDKCPMIMDIEAAHIAQPLKLQELLDADNANFGHDVFGISRYIDRETGKMTDCFLPRFSAPSV